MGLAQKRLMREAEPANSGHSGHTPKAQQRPDLLDINVQSTWDLHHRQVCRGSLYIHSTCNGVRRGTIVVDEQLLVPLTASQEVLPAWCGGGKSTC